MTFLLTTIQYHVEAWRTNGNKYQAAEMRLKAKKHIGDDMILVQHKLPFSEDIPHTFRFFEPNDSILFLNLLQGGYVTQNVFHNYCTTLLYTDETTLVWFVLHATNHEVHAALIMQYSYEPKRYNVTGFVCRDDTNAEGGLWLYMISLADTRQVDVEMTPKYISPVLRHAMMAAGFMQNSPDGLSFIRFPMSTLLTDIEIWLLLIQQWTNMLRCYVTDDDTLSAKQKKQTDIKHKRQPRLNV